MPVEIEFLIEGGGINLLQLLKATNLSETGGQSKDLVDQGVVKLNGSVETRYRAKLKGGDVVELPGHRIRLKDAV